MAGLPSYPRHRHHRPGFRDTARRRAARRVAALENRGDRDDRAPGRIRRVLPVRSGCPRHRVRPDRAPRHMTKGSTMLTAEADIRTEHAARRDRRTATNFRGHQKLEMTKVYFEKFTLLHNRSLLFSSHCQYRPKLKFSSASTRMF